MTQTRGGPSAPSQGQCLFYHLLPAGAATLSEWKQQGEWSLSLSPLKVPELRGPGSWSLLSPGRSCGLAVISHVLSSVDILPPIHTSTHMYTHVHTHTQHTCRLFITGYPSLAQPGSFLTAALVLLGRGGADVGYMAFGSVVCPPQRLLSGTASSAPWREQPRAGGPCLCPPCLLGVLGQGPCCAVVLLYWSLME